MDAVKILGNLIAKNAFGSKAGGNVLESLLGGGAGTNTKKATSKKATAKKTATKTTSTRSRSAAKTSGDLLSVLLGGKKGASAKGMGGLVALLPIILAATGKGGSTKGGGGLLGTLLGGGAGASGGIGGMLGGLGELGGLGDLAGSLLGGGAGKQTSGIADLSPQETEESVKILLEGMCLAARADSQVDDEERDAIMGKMGDLETDETAYLDQLLHSSVTVDDFARCVPRGMETQVYAFSLMAVQLDTGEEVEYFSRLAQALQVDGETANEIHRALGQPEIFQ